MRLVEFAKDRALRAFVDGRIVALLRSPRTVNALAAVLRATNGLYERFGGQSGGTTVWDRVVGHAESLAAGLGRGRGASSRPNEPTRL
ncbi:MAG: hypothetical protein JW751_27985 [Polyangiaceae bacterium]|nr:hypothetical protein [Polyangiaceae bacterium]